MGIFSSILKKLLGQDELDEMRETLNEQSQANSKLIKQNRELSLQVDSLQITKNSLDNKVKKIGEEKKGLKKSITAKDKLIKQKSSELKERNTELKKIRLELDTQNQANSELMKQIKELNSQMASIQKKMVGMDNKVKKAGEEKKELRESIRDKDKAIKKISSELETLNSQVSSLQKEKEILNDAVERAREEQKEEITNLEGQIQSLHEEKSTQQDNISKVEHQLQEKQNDLNNVLAELKQVRQEKSELQEQKEGLALQVSKLSEDKGYLQKEIDKLTSESTISQSTTEVNEDEPKQEEEMEEDTTDGDITIEVEEEDLEEETEENIPEAKIEVNEEEDTDDLDEIEDSEEEKTSEADTEGPKLGIEEEDSTTDDTAIEAEEAEEEKPEEEEEEVYGDEEENTIEPSRTRRRKTYRSRIDEIRALSGDAIQDFPEITTDTHEVKRSIITYCDENGNEDSADKFFEENSPEYIARISRQLADARIKGETFWSCKKCGGPIIVSARKNAYGESLFFTHAEKNVKCEWYTRTTKSRDRGASFDDDDEEIDEQQETIMDIKQFIYSLLCSQQSQQLGIKDVQIDSIIKSHFPFAKWRRPDFSFTYVHKDGKERKVVIQLQRKRQSVGDIADKDIFYRLNDTHVIWIFGCEEDNTYEYINRHAFKNTLFHNHRNVFVFDKESQEESKERNELVLKCNWLDVDDKWAINLEHDNKNGDLITIEDLTFDDEYCKPYYYDANTPYFEIHLEEKRMYEKTLVSREELLRALEEKWTRDKQYMDAQKNMRSRRSVAFPYRNGANWGFRFNETVLIQPIFTEEPRQLSNGYYVVKRNTNVGLLNQYVDKVLIDWNGEFPYDIFGYEDNSDRCIVCDEGKYGITDRRGKVLIELLYESVTFWSENIYKVKLNGEWGLCQIGGQMLTNRWYNDIGKLIGDRAEATIKDEGGWKLYHGHIDKNGKMIASAISNLPSGLSLIKMFDRWGIIDENGDELLSCEYDEIKHWHENFYRVCQGGKWGVIDVETGDYLLLMEYDSIGEVKSGIAIVKRNGRESRIGIDGKERAENEMDLRGGMKKICFSGKWGIFDSNGQEIIAPRYDDIGTFRGRFIGIINGAVIKLNAYYEYPIYLGSTKLSKQNEKSYIFKIGGVEFRLPKGGLASIGTNINEICDKGGYCDKLAFLNLNFSTKSYQLRFLKEEGLEKPLSHGDKDSDFNIGETYSGTINDCKKAKKKENLVCRHVIVSFPDGKKTKVPKRFFKASELDIEDYQIGTTIRLRKEGFDDALDQTIWKIEEIDF